MIFTKDNLPKSFIPYKILKVCSNSLIDGGHIVSVGNVLPLIIGKGEKPQVWIQAISNPETKEFLSIVENSVSKHSAVEVLEVLGAVVVTIQGVKIVSVKQGADDTASVEVLDLRPIGLNLSGNSTSLNVGGSSFSGNSMKGGGVLIGLGN